MIEITDSPDTKQWSEFVYKHPHGNIFQTPEMAEVYKRTKNYEPITLAAIDNYLRMLSTGIGRYKKDDLPGLMKASVHKIFK